MLRTGVADQDALLSFWEFDKYIKASSPEKLIGRCHLHLCFQRGIAAAAATGAWRGSEAIAGQEGVGNRM